MRETHRPPPPNGQPPRPRRALQRAVLALAASLAGTAPGALAASPTVAMPWAAGERIAFAIPAQPLATALGAYARQSGHQVLFTEEVVRGHATRALAATMTPRQALEHLLSGSGIEAREAGAGVYTLRKTASAEPYRTSNGTTLQEVRVLSTAEEQQRQALGVSTITADDLARRPPANDLAEILAMQPGVSLSGASSTGAYGNQREIDLRGMGAENTMILVDGKPVQSRQGAITRRTGDRDTGGDTNWVPADQIERIDILRGPAAARYGAGAAGGVINIITRKPTAALSGAVSTYASQPENALEGHGTQRIGFHLSGPLAEALSFRLYGNVAGTDGNRPTINGTLDDGSTNWVAGIEGRRNRDLNGLVRWDLAPGQVLEFEGGFSRLGNQYAGDTSNTTPTDESATVMGDWAARGAETRTVYRQNASVTHRGTWDGLGTSRIVFQYENARTRNCRQGFIGMGEGNCRLPEAQQHSDLDNLFAQGELHAPLQFGGLQQVLTTGIELRRQVLRDDNALLTTAAEPEFITLKSRTLAVYVEDAVAAGPSLVLTPGLRMEHHSDFGPQWNPSLNAVYELGDGITLKGGIARVAKAPTPYQTAPSYASVLSDACPYNGSGLVAGVDYDCTVRGNPLLRPEVSINQEVGVAWEGPRGWAASLAYFRNDYRNRIVAEATRLYDLNAPEDFEWHNAGRALVHGLEGSFNVPLRGVDGRQLALRNNLTWMFQNKDRDTGQPLSIIPKYTLHSTLDWRASAQLSMQLSATLYGRRTPRSLSYHGYRMVGDAARQRGAYALLDLAGSYEVNRHYRVGFGIRNLLDRQVHRAARLAYVNTGAVDGVVSSGAGALTYNEPGRSVYLSFTAMF